MRSWTALVLMPLLLLAGAAAADGAEYETIHQDAQEPGRLRSAPMIQVAPPAFSGFPWQDHYDTGEAWDKEKGEIQAACAKAFLEAAEKEGLAGRVRMLTPGEKTRSGIVAGTRLVEFPEQGKRGGTVLLSITDEDTGYTLLSAKLKVLGKGRGVAGRLSVMLKSASCALLAVMKHGTLDPERR